MFGKRVTLFTLLGFAVRVDVSWLVIATLVTWSLAVGYFPASYPDLQRAVYWWMGAAGMLGLFGSIVVHELAHSLVARRYGLPMSGITLFIFGGVAEMQDEPPSAKAEGLMAVAGPIVSMVLGGVCTWLAAYGKAGGWPSPVFGVLAYLGFINQLVAVFNLIPAFPLDGGRIFRSLMWAWKGNFRWATRIAAQMGKGFSFILIALGLLTMIQGNFIGGLWRFLLGMFLHNAAESSYQQLMIRQALAGEKVRRFMQPNPVTVSPTLTVQELTEEYIYRYHFKTFPVVSHGRLLGYVSTREVKALPRQEWKAYTVRDILQPCDADNTVGPSDDAMQALAKMNQTGLGRLLVVDGERLVGVLALKDLLAFLALKVELEGTEN
jgi:Zn-dependent protease/CBS domain-containing protein